MELWIRSQDRKRLIKCEKLITVEFTERTECEIWNDTVKLGTYKNIEKTLEVLDEIQEAQLGNYHYRCPSNVKVSNNGNTIVYEMPKE